MSVVLLSAGANLPEQVSLLGVREYIQKPIPLPRLLEIVGQYCSGGSSAPLPA